MGSSGIVLVIFIIHKSQVKMIHFKSTRQINARIVKVTNKINLGILLGIWEKEKKG